MDVKSIADRAATVYKEVVQLKQPVKDKAGAVAPTTPPEDPLKAPDAVKVVAPVSLADNNPVREMSHVSDSYDARGNLITKYMDSSNEVVYQTPSDSVLREQELMRNNQAANVKA